MEAGEWSGMNGAVPLSRLLSRRELEVLNQLFVSPNTVNKHVHQVLRKLEVSNRVQAAIYGRIEQLGGSTTS